MARVEPVSIEHKGDCVYITQEADCRDDQVVILNYRQVSLFVEMLVEEATKAEAEE
jgi:hypothetical protein